MDFSDIEIFEFRKLMYSEIKKLPNCELGPEKKDFEQVKPKIVPVIAYKIWEKMQKPKDKDIDIWLKAEEMWDFIRYVW